MSLPFCCHVRRPSRKHILKGTFENKLDTVILHMKSRLEVLPSEAIPQGTRGLGSSTCWNSMFWNQWEASIKLCDLFRPKQPLERKAGKCQKRSRHMTSSTFKTSIFGITWYDVCQLSLRLEVWEGMSHKVTDAGCPWNVPSAGFFCGSPLGLRATDSVQGHHRLPRLWWELYILACPSRPEHGWEWSPRHHPFQPRSYESSAAVAPRSSWGRSAKSPRP